MLSPEFGLRPKSQEELSRQLQSASTLVDPESDILTPPSLETGDLLSMPLAEIKKKFARRYDIYLRLLREIKRPESEDETNLITDAELDQMRKWLLALNSLDEYISCHQNGNGEKTLRGERQVTVFDDIRNFIEEGGQEGYVKLPTGFGKTVLFVEMIEATRLRSLVVVPTIDLINQTAEKFKKFAPEIEYGLVYEEAKDFSKPVTIITYDSLIAQIKNGNLDPEDYDCLILDEVHGALSGERTKAVKKFGGALKLGFTATPVYSKGEKEVSKLLGTEIHRLTIREAVEEGYLSSFSSVVANTTVDLSTVEVTADGEFSEEQLEKAVNKEARNKAAVELYQQAFSGQTAVVYCVGVKHAEAVARLFNESGIKATYIAGVMTPPQRRRILKDFSTGEIQVLTNADLLIEGFDEQRASVCLNLRPTRSLVVAEQRGGRVLRVDDNNPNKHAEVVDFVDKGVEKRGQVLFAQVAEGVEFEPKKKGKGGGGGGGPRVDWSKVKVSGLDIEVDTEEILKIVSRVKRPDKVELIRDLEILKSAIKATGVEPKGNLRQLYNDLRQTHLDWPSEPQKTLLGWKGWPDLWGVVVERKILIKDLSILKAAVQATGVVPKGSLEELYNDLRQTHLDWPSEPRRLVGWVNWPDLWGLKGKEKNDKIELIKDLPTLRAAIKATGVETNGNLTALYYTMRRTHPTWPSRPRQLDGWVDWPHLFGLDLRMRERKTLIRNLEELKAAIKATGVSPSTNLRNSYYELRVSNPSWPSDPNYLEGWISWVDLWGGEVKEKVLIKDLETLKSAIMETGVKPKGHLEKLYHDLRKIHSDWPSMPYSLPGWKNWPDFFGLEKKRLIKDMDTLKAVVKACGVEPEGNLKKLYLELRKTHLDWPSSPRSLEGWRSWTDLWGLE